MDLSYAILDSNEDASPISLTDLVNGPRSPTFPQA
jgi:hypothetical protein